MSKGDYSFEAPRLRRPLFAWPEASGPATWAQAEWPGASGCKADQDLNDLLNSFMILVTVRHVTGSPAIENVKLRIKRKAAVVYILPYITCTGNAGKHLDFRVPFSTV